MKRSLRVLGRVTDLYFDRMIPRSAAALSYYLTMSVFPLIICLYTLLGNSFSRAMSAMDVAEEFLSEQTISYIRGFLVYVAKNHNNAMLLAGVLMLLTTASAGVRSVQSTIGELQGLRRYQGLSGVLFSLAFSVAFLAAMYFSILVMFTGETFLDWLSGRFPQLNISSSWEWMRFLVLGGLELVIFLGVYASSRPRRDPYALLPGALLATVGTVFISWVFSAFIAVSVRYSMVYSSLASLILLMFWLFLICQVIYVGAAFNVAIRDVKREDESAQV